MLWRRVFWSQVEYKIVCFILVIGKSRLDKLYGDRWSHLCSKKWLFFTNLGQGLSSKVGFFLIF